MAIGSNCKIDAMRDPVRPKILIYNPLGAIEGHSQKYATDLCTGLRDRGADVLLVTSQDFDASDVVSKGVKVVATPVGDSRARTVKVDSLWVRVKWGFWTIWRNIQSFMVLRKAMKDYKPDCCHLIGGETMSNIVFIRSQLLSMKLVIFALTIHNADYVSSLYSHDGLKKWYKIISKVLVRGLVKTRARVFTHGEAMRVALAEQLGLDAARIKIHKVPVTQVAPVANLEGTSKEKPVLLFVGVMRHDKGFDIFCNALARLPHRNWRLRVAGSVRQVGEKYLHDAVNSAGINGNWSIKPDYLSTEELQQEYLSADIVVLPYRKGFLAQSVVMTEGAFYHRPLITTSHSQNGFDTVKYRLGWTFESENVDDLAKTIERALEEIKLCKQEFGFDGYVNAHKPEEVAREMLDGYFA